MFDLKLAVRAWRNEFAKQRSFSATDLDELEDHLRAAYELELDLNPGLAPAEAFSCACETLGSPADLSVEFAKVDRRSWRGLLTAGWVLFVVSFFLPAHEFGVSGLQAFWLALSGEAGAVGVLSALTNLLMPLTGWRPFHADRRGLLARVALLLAGVALNLWWFTYVDRTSELQAGYFAWLASFGLVGTGLLLRARALPETLPVTT
jgi:hypothetical protein